ncbi:androgen-dependent TFPI-regulating protein-like isoform X1 [Acyrthosiphon pisum]|uniref:Androgen-dependent TFPI-regulating protein-like n=2 Tax=Acyrthosiphon pisum TaxID=7029 RepID=A0A8R1W8G4_ACYPI|nr:androgen-dependent TFPI-regulating protein-like isoform X1 [Acyrthosiphon pisum]|eukprot:XP_001951281.1 PREDICTED: androgen-dependent TFPI-regulating protein-like [Acyrthosiphon pisum]
MSVYPILLHAGACLWYVFFWNNFLNNGSGKKESDWDPRYRDIHEMGTRFLTNWNLFIQTLFFGGCLFHDLMKILNGPNWLKLGSKFQTILSLSFSSILLPTGIFVCVTFWAMYAYDREVIYPKIVDNYIPYWQNHGMHTIILPLLLAELFTTRHKFPSVTASMSIFLGFGICYGLVFLGTYVEKGRWVYPLFGLFSFPISLGIMAVLFFKLMSFLFVGIFIQNMYWGKEEKKRHRKSVKKSS